MQSSKLVNQELKNTSDTNQLKATKRDNISEYDKQMIEKYQSEIKDGTLTIYQNQDLKSLDFMRLLNLQELELKFCNNIIPKLESQTIKMLKIQQCKIQSVKDFQLENLEVLEIYNQFDQLESKTLVQEILRFKKLKGLSLYKYITDLSPLLQITRLSKLSLIECNLYNTEALRPLINLVELNLNSNDIDITVVQYLTNLTNLSLRCCNLVSLHALRPLKKLEELDIFNNKIVFLQPLVELKMLSKLDARFNKIMDTESIQLHPNFDCFMIDNQDVPIQDELKVANIMRDINNQISSLQQICKESSRIKEINTVLRQKIAQQLQLSYNCHEQCVARAANLFQTLSSLDDCQ
ncbi:leucine-rich_repeat domain-containing protein [Hexamita inflata]|uniref:Leucine-rich_repeat domain-containing protein n=1 Tax=Hexamita inflata TaxID=28002 RepID=A0ABP1HG43_9EUKA